MIFIRAKRDDLLDPLAAVSGIIERRHTLPILSNVLLDVSGGSLTFLATDIEIQIAASHSVPASGDRRATTVNARKFIDILRALPPGADVEVQLQDKRLTVKAGKSRFTLQTLPVDDFPRLASPAGDRSRFSIPQSRFRSLLHLVQYAMAQQDIRYYLNGLLVSIDGRDLRLVATDGHRLAYVATVLDSDLPRQDVIVPRKTIAELAKLLGTNDDPLEVELSATQAGFRFGSIHLLSKLVDGKFPDYNRVIPMGHRNSLTITRESLRQALLRAAILSNEKFRGVRWVLSKGSLRIASSNADQEEAIEEIDVAYDGDALDIGFNVNYVLDVLNNVDAENVDCSLGDAASSALMQFSGLPDFKYVVMPMRI